jgi:hypothetical protein
MPAVIVPVGLYLGPSYRYVTPPDPTPEYWEVRFGADSGELDADEYRVWATAFLDPKRHERLEINRSSLLLDLIVADRGPTDAVGVLDRLLEQGLLLEYDTDGSLEKAFSRIRLFPLAEGLGNTPEEPDRYRIGHNGVSLVEVAGVVRGLWAASSLDPSLWHACAGMDEDNRQAIAAGEDLERLTADEAARQIAITMPMLIASGCAFLDPVA